MIDPAMEKTIDAINGLDKEHMPVLFVEVVMNIYHQDVKLFEEALGRLLNCDNAAAAEFVGQVTDWADQEEDL